MFMLYRDIVAVCCEKHIGYLNIVIQSFLFAAVSGTYIYHSLLKVW